MAIDLGTLKYSNTVERPLVPGAEVTDEGKIIKSVLVGGEEHFQASAGGNANEVLVGFSYNSSIVPDTEVVIEDTLVVPAAAPYTIQLKNTNILTGSVYVYDATAGAALAFNAAAGAGQYNIDLATGLLTFNTAEQGHALVVTYRYALTRIQKQQKFWDRPVNTPDAGFFGNLVVVCGNGEIYTNQFDSSVSFEGVSKVYAGANGMVTSVQGSNTLIPARIIKLPTAASPFLGLAFNFA